MKAGKIVILAAVVMLICQFLSFYPFATAIAGINSLPTNEQRGTIPASSSNSYKIPAEAGAEDASDTVREFYGDILGRNNPSAKEVKYWADKVANGMSLEDIKKAFYNSNEFKGKAEKVIKGYYKDILGRATPSEKEVAYWVGEAVKGKSFSDIEKKFLSSNEYKLKHPTNNPDQNNTQHNDSQPKTGDTQTQSETGDTQPQPKTGDTQPQPKTGDVQPQLNTGDTQDQPKTGDSQTQSETGDSPASLQTEDTSTQPSTETAPDTTAPIIKGYYKDILGRNHPSDKEVKYWVDKAANGMSLEDIKKAFYNSNEFKGKAEKVIKGYYKDIMGRANPANSEVAYWVGEAVKGKSFSDIEKKFLSSNEYKLKHPDGA